MGKRKGTGWMNGHFVRLDADEYDVDGYHFMQAYVTHEMVSYIPDGEWSTLTEQEQKERMVKDLNQLGVTEIDGL